MKISTHEKNGVIDIRPFSQQLSEERRMNGGYPAQIEDGDMQKIYPHMIYLNGKSFANRYLQILSYIDKGLRDLGLEMLDRIYGERVSLFLGKTIEFHPQDDLSLAVDTIASDYPQWLLEITREDGRQLLSRKDLVDFNEIKELIMANNKILELEPCFSFKDIQKIMSEIQMGKATGFKIKYSDGEVLFENVEINFKDGAGVKKFFADQNQERKFFRICPNYRAIGQAIISEIE